MADPEQAEEEETYVEHQYMCSECQELFDTLEDVLIHQQIHTGQEVESEAVEGISIAQMGQNQQFQCLECGSLLVNSEELLQHQEMHMQEAGLEVAQQGEGSKQLSSGRLLCTNVYCKWF